MIITKDQTITGIPLKKIRDCFKKLSTGGYVTFGVEFLKDDLEISKKAANLLVQDLLREKYIQLDTEHCRKEFPYTLDSKGNTLRNASAAPPIKRVSAEKKLQDLLNRVKEYNSNPLFPYLVHHVAVFGSFLSDKQLLGDIDIAYDYVQKVNYRELANERVRIAETKGRIFFDLNDLFWPEKELRLLLKNKDRGLSLHGFDEVLRLAENNPEFKYKIVFEEQI